MSPGTRPVEDRLRGYSVRQGTDDDARALAELDRRSSPAPWTAEHFQKELAKPFSHLLVMTDDETDEQVIAFLAAWVHARGDCEILNVAVDLRMRRLGVAELLIENLRRQALRAQCTRMVLNVRTSNAAAIALYQKAHFAIEHTRKRFYSNGEDAYEMVIDLTGAGPRFQ
jgi:ribosomal-protein-alanine N-acetyltransferase